MANFDEIEEARKLLALGEAATLTEINAPFAIIARAKGSGAVTSAGEGGTRTPTPCGT